VSVRVNILPREVERRERARRAVGVLVFIGLLFVAGLVALYLLQLSRVNAAKDELTVAEGERNERQAEVDELGEYAQLQSQAEAASALLVEALGGHVSFAGILQDVAAVMPTDAALTTLGITMNDEPTEVDGSAATGPSFGVVSGTGDALRGHAPGVERVLLEFDKVAAFFNVFLTNSTIDEEDIAVFSFEVDLGPEIFTGQYLDGLPEELR
jgi:Tfp pilus assembly protein PilN